jgi:4-hydroxybenzoate polyprenyltransferase
MTSLTKLIRLPNLIIIALTMCGVRYGLLETLWLDVATMLRMEGAADVSEWRLHMKGIDFILLLASVLLVAASGYIINDYFDVKADRINKPERMVIGSAYSRRMAIGLHLGISLLGLLLALIVSYRSGRWEFASLQLFSIIALWFYSSHLKKQLLSGNVLIAFLAALVPMTVGIYEFVNGSLPSIEKLNLLLPGAGSSLFTKAALLVSGFSLFAFLTNLIREIVKDTEDMQGDMESGCRTLPIVIGEHRTRFLLLFLIIFTSGLLGFVQEYLFQARMNFLFWYVLISTQLPLIFLAYIVWKAAQKSDYTKASLVCKLIIVSGVLSMFMFRYS